jgi:RND superfamily putative drug exporter
VFVVLANVISGAMNGAAYNDSLTLPKTETEQVTSLLKAAGLGDEDGARGTIVFHAKSGSLRSAPGDIAEALRQLCKGPDNVINVDTPWRGAGCAVERPSSATPANPELLSPDGATALASVSFKSGYKIDNTLDVYDKFKTFNSDTVQAEFTDVGFSAIAAQQKGIPPLVFGFIAALIILALVFRTLGATALPLVMAAAALGSGLSLMAMLTHVMNVASFAPQLMELMVLGVGVDYALFIVTRHRRNLLAGMAVKESIVVAISTAGRAVLFAGITVCIALLGLCALGVGFFYGVAISTALAVGLTLIASITLLPAMLTVLGLKVLPRRQRRALRAGTYVAPERVSAWARWASFVEKKSLVLGVIAGVFIIMLSVPFFSIRLGHADQGNDSDGTTTRAGYELIAAGFGPGYNSTLELVVSGPQATDKAFLGKVKASLTDASKIDQRSVRVIPVSKAVTFIAFKSIDSPQNVKTTALVKDLRTKVLPPIYRGTSNHVYVYGQTAVFIDFAKVLSAKMPLFFGAVVGLSFLLLMVAFRSILIPVTAAAMNLLAATASFGIVVAIFQWGWLSDLVGIGKGGPIEPFLPVIFFAILFGLSIDYQVFLVSRMHEEWIHTRDNRRSIEVGQRETGGIITAAALIMIAVFAAFILGDDRVIKLFGVGLAAAVFLDAFILRTVLVPVLMHRFGDANWYFPRWLERVTPHVSVEAPEEAPANTAVQQPARELALVAAASHSGDWRLTGHEGAEQPPAGDLRALTPGDWRS